VIGAGTIGLLSGALARHLGAEVSIVARHDAQRRAAEALGLGLGAPRDCDIVFEAAGTASGFDDAVRACRRSGTMALVSTTWEAISISFLNAQMREVTIVPAFVYGEAHGHREFETAAVVLGEHPEIIEPLITHRFGLDEAPRAFEVATDRAHGAIKVVLHP
jgi:threonine dehydrogenase-like Zn-dependent dehydrogenase